MDGGEGQLGQGASRGFVDSDSASAAHDDVVLKATARLSESRVADHRTTGHPSASPSPLTVPSSCSGDRGTPPSFRSRSMDEPLMGSGRGCRCASDDTTRTPSPSLGPADDSSGHEEASPYPSQPSQHADDSSPTSHPQHHSHSHSPSTASPFPFQPTKEDPRHHHHHHYHHQHQHQQAASLHLAIGSVGRHMREREREREIERERERGREAAHPCMTPDPSEGTQPPSVGGGSMPGSPMPKVKRNSSFLFSPGGPPENTLEYEVDLLAEEYLRWAERRRYQLARVQSGGGLYVYVRGSGPDAVILLHGIGMTSNWWREGILSYMNPKCFDQFTFYCPDLLGFGRSADLPTDENYSIDEQAKYLQRDIVERYQLETYHIAGHSFGALIGLRLAAYEPGSVKSCILFSPAFFPNQEEAEKHIAKLGFPCDQTLYAPSLFRVFIRTVNQLSAVPWVQKLILQVVPTSEVPKESLFDFIKTEHDAFLGVVQSLVDQARTMEPTLKMLKRKRVKVVNMHGTADLIVPYSFSQSVADRFSNIELRGFPDGPHHFPISHPRLLAVWVEQELFRSVSARRYRTPQPGRLIATGESLGLGVHSRLGMEQGDLDWAYKGL
ncbi:unnamed protein product [Vitrella brassicaformis CCMP3155]|uniref:AB hydrolase-1 domain-containing protein n=3 Tax=Vitrella brassicaformis TaxID=1169539 RepID=A0A0G4EXV8_VITBC|nr:unnamed protein product [Vitrella brassicaformis CCMP3155]|eukprot:CEM03449.1 unnamed protein product [Vitrella brassicaformis CCMP3155]